MDVHRVGGGGPRERPPSACCAWCPQRGLEHSRPLGQEERWLGAEKSPKALTLSPWGWPRPPVSLWSVSNCSGAPNEATSAGRDRETWGNWG